MSSDTTVGTEEQELLGLHHEWVRANRTGDTGWCRQHMRSGDQGVRLFNTNGSEYLGVEHWCSLWDVYRTVIKGDRTANEPPQFSSEEIDVHARGDVAWVTYWIRAKADLPDRPLPELSRGTEVWERVDGSWRMVHGHWSFGGPGATASGRGPEPESQAWVPLH